MLEGLRDAGAPISIDTSKVAVAEAALDAGARMVNDVTALRAEPELAALCAERDCGVVLMHMQGTPRTMQEAPTYDDVVDDVKGFLAERIEFATSEGVAEERIWIDPGIGFGKTVEHNLELLRRLGELRELGRPIVSAPPARASSASSRAARSASGSAARSPPTCWRCAAERRCSASTTSPRCGRRSTSPRRSWAVAPGRRESRSIQA